jgi:predicted DNA-binding WGR domain protein
MMAVYLEKRDPDKRQARFYRIRVSQTLFGSWAVMREWGRIGSAGTVRETWYDSEAEALGAGEKLLAQKTKRGYQRVGSGY